MFDHLADISIQSLLIALPAAIVVWIAGRNRTAALEHAIWTAVVCGMLALFTFGQALPRLPLRVLDARPASASTSERVLPPMMFGEISEASPVTIPAPKTPRRPIDWSAVMTYMYGAIALAFLARFVTGMFLIRKLRGTAVSISYMGADRQYESGRITVPVTIGWLRSRILLPLDWRDWSQDKLDAVLAHEGAHVRRHDGLIAALAHVNRCIFWFHPLAWMLERRLAMLAERACDESTVATLGDPNRYAQLLLEMAIVVDSSEGRLRYHALTMATGSRIRGRIDLVLQEGRAFSRGLSWAGWTAVLLCGIPLVLGAGTVELDRQPALMNLEIPRSNVPVPPLPEQRLQQPASAHSPVVLAQVESTPARPAAQIDVSPHFITVSVTPAAGGALLRINLRGRTDPERLHWTVDLRMLIAFASRVNMDQITGPDFIDAGAYEINAQLPPGATEDQIHDMAANLLAERFGLVAHRVTKDVTAYQMTVAPSGPKQLTPAASLTDADTPTQRPRVPMNIDEDGFPLLRPGSHQGGVYRDGMKRMTFRASTMAALAEDLRSDLTNSGSGEIVPVTDQTGLSGLFDFHLEIPSPRPRIFAQLRQQLDPDVTKASEPSVSPSDVSAALERQLGLRLYPVVTKLDTILVDYVNRVPADH